MALVKGALKQAMGAWSWAVRWARPPAPACPPARVAHQAEAEEAAALGARGAAEARHCGSEATETACAGEPGSRSEARRIDDGVRQQVGPERSRRLGATTRRNSKQGACRNGRVQVA